MPNFEKLGVFHLGRTNDPEKRRRRAAIAI
jgi:hypothetical protein